MPPNFGDVPTFDPEALQKSEKIPSSSEKKVEKTESCYQLEVIRGGLNSLAHTLIGITVAVCLWYALRNILTTPLSPTQQHIVLCVLGYQLLMAEAILCFTSGNGWSTPLKLKHKRLAHWVLQISGSALAIAGSVIAINMKSPHNFNSNHGILALVALICTVISLVNGLTSLYAFELRRFIRPNIGKLGHICFGTATFIASTTTLCLGMDKNGFKNWSSPEFARVLMGFSGFYTFVIICNPLMSMASRLKSMTS